MTPAAAARFSTGVDLFGLWLPIGAEIGIVCALAVGFLALAVRQLGRPE
ncbi:MAG: hypothetical protein M0029_00560 [Actinomycetota bacterium]|jgi:hypothetical protein|nr:hypothetical protein [Actinomycetota bacterium]